jgi:hypothetical protein
MDLLAAILDNDCDPANPYTIKLHCKVLEFHWVRVKSGYWVVDGMGCEHWVPGVYAITKMDGVD